MPLTRDELRLRFESGHVTVTFDTNAIHEMKTWREVCRLLGRLRPTFPNRALVSSLVHSEMLFDLQQRCGSDFDAQLVVSSLLDLSVDVVPFDNSASDAFAARLGRLFPSEGSWRAAKARASRNCLGINDLTLVPGTGRTCGANVDWFIAAHAVATGAILVGHDEGPEFEGIDRVALGILATVASELVARVP